jgi:DNA-binding transcriptional regulator YiaG
MGRFVNKQGFYIAGEDARDPLPYRACGLEGIFLLNGYEIVEHDGDKGVSITNLEGLHRAIGHHIVTERKTLAPKEIRFLRNTIGMTQAELASCLGVTSQTVARWEKAQCDVPGSAEKLLRIVFLAAQLTTDELEEFRKTLLAKIRELDEMDEISAPPANFIMASGSGRWSERERERNLVYA